MSGLKTDMGNRAAKPQRRPPLPSGKGTGEGFMEKETAKSVQKRGENQTGQF
jgi:hypothetical protein